MKILLRLRISSSLIAAAAVALFLPSLGQAQGTWSFDPTFQRTPLLVTSEAATGVKVLSSGKVLTYTINGLLLSGANGQRIGALVRVDPTTGAIDPTWNPDPTLTGAGFLGVAEAPGGKIYYSTTLTGDLAYQNRTDPAVNRLIRLNADGSRDSSFNSPIFAFVARFVTVQPDGKIIVCSGGIPLSGVPPAGSIVQTVRLNTDGTLDNTFQSPNFQLNTAADPPASVAGGNYFDAGVFGNPVVDSTTGQIYFCGPFRFVNGQPRKAIVRCNADGTLDSSFVPTGLAGGSIQLIGRAIVLQAGGKVVLGGHRLRTAAGGNTYYALLRFNADGTLDPSFNLFPTTNSSGTPLVPGYTGPRDIHETPDGKILTSDTRVIRFLSDGTVDPSFGPLDVTSPFFTNGVDGVVGMYHHDINPSTGAAYLSGPGPSYGRLGGMAIGNITKLNSDGTIDTQFNAPVVNSENFAPNVQISASGSVYVSGGHTAFGNTGNATVARLLADGTRDPSFSLGTLPFTDKQGTGVALLPDGSAYVNYFSGSFNGSYSFSNLVRLLPTGAIDTSFRLSSALQASLGINAFDGSDTAKVSTPQISAASGGRVYVFDGGSAQATVNANGNLKPIRINTDGTEDTTAPALGFPVGEVTRDASGITGGSTGYLGFRQTASGNYIGLVSVAPFPTSTGNPYNYRVMKLRADGSVDPAFNSPTLSSTVPASQNFPTLFDPVTGLTTQPAFYERGDDPVTSGTMLADGSVVLIGNFQVAGQPGTKPLAKFTATGAFDPSFEANLPAAPQNVAHPTRPVVITSARVAPDGKIWVLGRFDTVGGHPAPGVARLNSDGTLDNTFQLADVSYYDSFGDAADVVFANGATAYLIGTFRHTGDPLPFAVTRILGPPLITSPTTAAGIVGQQFVYQFLTSGATSVSVTSLPPGLSFDPTLSVIVGTPTTSGVFQIDLTASNSVGTTMATLSLDIQPPPSTGPVITSSTSATGRVAAPFSFQVITTGGSPATRVSATGLPSGLTLDAVTGLISGTPTTEGSTAVSLTAVDGALSTTSQLQLTFTSNTALPVIVSSSSASLSPGQAFSYTISAPATVGPDDVTTFTLIGTLPMGLVFDSNTGTISGTFTTSLLRALKFPNKPDLSGGIVSNVQLFATNSHGTSTIPLNFFLAPTGAVNISTRLAVGGGDNVLIAGFILSGNAPKKVIIRAIGPSSHVPGAMQDPTLELHDAKTTLGSNDNWRDTQEDEIIASTVAPTDDRESAIVATLESNNATYTAIVRSKDNTPGIAVVELYDLGTASLDASSTARLAEISTRGTVLTNDDVMIGGFYISGQATKVIMRAIGPSLTALGVPGALGDPILEIRDSSGSLINMNDDWQSTQAQQIKDTGVPPSDPRESAIVATLSPGPYTGVVRGKNDTTGVALVEVYVLQ